MNKLKIANYSLGWGTGLSEMDLLNCQNWGKYSVFKKRVITPKLKKAITLVISDQFQPNFGSG
jgi:hypothetical protein